MLSQNPNPRLFVAVPLPQQLKMELGKWIQLKRKEWTFQNWIHEQDVHVTLQFLGEVTLTQKAEIITALMKLSTEQESFPLEIDGIGTFGRTEQPRILWAGVEGDLGQLHQLQKKITEKLRPIGFQPDDRPYRPHVTLARKFKGNTFTISQTDQWGTMTRAWIANHITLYETKLGQQPMYQPIASFPLSTKQDQQG
jgi:2'-5' RNA ligase